MKRRLLLAATLSGCAVGPDFQPPTLPEQAGYTKEPLTRPAQATVQTISQTSGSQTFHPGADTPGDWWRLYRSPALDSLVNRALAHNPTLDSAQAALRQARYATRAQQGAFYPQLSATASSARTLTATGSVSPLAASNNPYLTLYTGELSVSYLPDVFGLNRRQVESTAALAENQRFQLEAAYLTLTANVVNAAIQEASLRAQIDATEQIVGVTGKSVALLQKQFDLGQVARSDLLVQQAALNAAQATLPPLQKQLAQQRDLIATLSGQFPNDQPEETFTLASLHLPPDLPVSLPAFLVQQRPDIRAAEATWRSNSALIGVAIANRLPLATLTAQIGANPSSIASIFAANTSFFSLGATATQPLFQGFTLLFRERAARAAADQSAADYRTAVLNGFQNVADSLRALQSDADAVRTAEAAEATAGKSLDIAQSQLRLGSVNTLVLLTAQQTLFQANLAAVQARAARLSDTAALFQSLGGGWWNRNDVTQPAKESIL